MRNVGTLILIATAIAAGAAMAQERQLAGPASRQADDTATVLRRVEIPHDVLALYEALAPLSIVEQREVLNGVLPEVKRLLWTNNLYVFLDNHPALTPKQRAAVRKDLEYVQLPGVFARAVYDTPQPSPTAEALSGVEAAVAAADFPDEMIVTAFLHLGALAPARHERPYFDVGVETNRPPASPTTYPDCMCRSNVGCWEYYVAYCDWAEFCVPVTGCGYNGTDKCLGVCTNGSV